MSKLGNARLLLEADGVPSGSLIYILRRDGNRTRFIYRKEQTVHDANIGANSLLMFPLAKDILLLLSDHTTVGVMWHLYGKREGWYSIVSLQFGVKTEHEVPVYAGKKKKGTRIVTSTRHVNIRAKTFDSAVYLLFFATLGGKLCRKNMDGSFSYLHWDNLQKRFKVETRKDS